MLIPLFISAVTIAFPSPGRRLPPVERCYVIGTAPRGAKTVEVGGHPVEVYRTGAWATTVAVTPGENTVAATAPDGTGTNVTFFVERRPETATAGTSVVARAAAPRTYEKLEYSADAPKAKMPRTDNSEYLIAVDAGHGGRDTGAISPHGGYEKTANLAIARAVERELTARGFRVLMTRDRDVAVELKERAREAHARGADLFVSLHHDAPAADGDAAAARFCSVYCWNDLGEVAARKIEAKVAAALAADGVPSHGVQRRNFAVTRSNEIPSVLVECDFITHPAGEERSCDADARRRLASAIADGVAAAVKEPVTEGETE